jgi:hypothetical protein
MTTPHTVKVTDDVGKRLKFYVYVYIDPLDGKPFYIGKGKGNRISDHLNDKSDEEMFARINKIRSKGKEPQREILRYGLSEPEAHLVEAAAIDLLGKGNLINRVSGHHKGSYGRITFQDLMTILTAKPVKVQHKAILITINQLYRSDMTPLELFEATRGIWVIGPRRNNAEYAMAVYQGIVREVYHIKKWHPAGTLKYRTRSEEDVMPFEGMPQRWEFSGSVATDIRDKYFGFSVGTGGQNPIRYENV